MNSHLPMIIVALGLAGGLSSVAACTTGTSAMPSDAVGVAPQVIDPDDADTIPCGPRRVLQTICQRCHTKPPTNGAPFPLVTRSNIVRVSPDGQISELMIEVIEAGRMPLSPVTIDYDSRETLLDWLHAGAPAAPPTTCSESSSVDAGEARDAGATPAAPPDSQNDSAAPESSPELDASTDD